MGIIRGIPGCLMESLIAGGKSWRISWWSRCGFFFANSLKTAISSENLTEIPPGICLQIHQSISPMIILGIFIKKSLTIAHGFFSEIFLQITIVAVGDGPGAFHYKNNSLISLRIEYLHA